MDLKPFCIIKSNSLPIDFETTIIKLTATEVYLKNTILPSHVIAFMEGSEFTLRSGERKFRTPRISSDGVHIIFSLEDEQKYENSREETRYLMNPSANAFLTFVNPIDKITILRKKIHDLSRIGLAFETPRKNGLFSKSRKLQTLTIEYNGKNLYSGEGETLHTRQVFCEDEKEKCLVGIRLYPPIDEAIIEKLEL